MELEHTWFGFWKFSLAVFVMMLPMYGVTAWGFVFWRWMYPKESIGALAGDPTWPAAALISTGIWFGGIALLKWISR